MEEMEDATKASPKLRIHFLANLHETKGIMCALKVKSNVGFMHPLSQFSFEIGPGSKNLRRYKNCSKTYRKNDVSWTRNDML